MDRCGKVRFAVVSAVALGALILGSLPAAGAGPGQTGDADDVADLLSDLASATKANGTWTDVGDRTMIDPRTSLAVDRQGNILGFGEVQVGSSAELAQLLNDALPWPNISGADGINVPGTSDFYAGGSQVFGVIGFEIENFSCQTGVYEFTAYLYGEGTEAFQPNPAVPEGAGQGATTAISYVHLCDADDVWGFIRPVDGAPQRFAFPLLAGIGATPRDTTMIAFVVPNPVEFQVSQTYIPDPAAVQSGGDIFEWASERTPPPPPQLRIERTASGLFVVRGFEGEELPGLELIDFDAFLGADDGTDDGGGNETDTDGSGEGSDENATGGVDESGDSDGGGSNLPLILGLLLLGAVGAAAAVKLLGKRETKDSEDGNRSADDADVLWISPDDDELLAGLVIRASELAIEDGESVVNDEVVIPSLAVWDRVLDDADLDPQDYRRFRVVVYASFGRAEDATGREPLHVPDADGFEKPASAVWYFEDTRDGVVDDLTSRVPDEFRNEGVHNEALYLEHRKIAYPKNSRLAQDRSTGKAIWRNVEPKPTSTDGGVVPM